MHHPQEQYIEEGVDWESIVVEYNQPLQDTFEQVSAIHGLCSPSLPFVDLPVSLRVYWTV